MSTASTQFRRVARELDNDDLLAENGEMRRERDKLTKAIESLLGLIDDSDIGERYPGIIDAAERLERLV